MNKILSILAISTLLASCSSEKETSRIVYDRAGLEIQVFSRTSSSPTSRIKLFNKLDKPRMMKLVINAKYRDKDGVEKIGREVLEEGLKMGSSLDIGIDGDEVVNLEVVELDGEKLLPTEE